MNMDYPELMNRGTNIPKSVEYFSELYSSHYCDLVRFAEALLYDHEEARDVVQEVFCYLWDNSERIVITQTIKSYLFSSVKNVAFNRIKHLKIIDKHSDQIREAWWFALSIDPDEDSENLTRINEISKTFPAQMKRVFKLRTEEDLKYEEIAKELGISVNSVKTHLKRSFSILREKLLIIAIIILCTSKICISFHP